MGTQLSVLSTACAVVTLTDAVLKDRIRCQNSRVEIEQGSRPNAFFRRKA